jgi:flagellar export protein FliJ
MSRRFRLAVVLRLREIEEDSARAALGGAIARHIAALADRHLALERVSAEQVWLRRMQMQAEANAGTLREAARSIEAATVAATAADQSLNAAAQVLLEARARLAQAKRRREVVERLRDRHVAAERARDDHAEVLRLADVAGVQHVYRGAAERQT